MLMTVLRGELAVKQSRALIRMFKMMKDYVMESQELSKYRNNLSLVEKVIDNSRSIEEVRGEIKRIDSGMAEMNKRLNETVKSSELSPLLLDYKKDCHREIGFIRTDGKIHDRFIVLDYGTNDEQIYFLGASEKDAGSKISMIIRLERGVMKNTLHDAVGKLMQGEELKLA